VILQPWEARRRQEGREGRGEAKPCGWEHQEVVGHDEKLSEDDAEITAHTEDGKFKFKSWSSRYGYKGNV